VLGRRPRRQLDHEQADEHGDVARGVDPEAPRNSQLGDDDRADARSNDAGEIEPAGVERDRAGQVVASNELDHQGLSGGDLERGDQPVHRRESEQPTHRDVTRPVEPPERRRLETEQRLSDLHEAQLVGAVDDDAGVEREQ